MTGGVPGPNLEAHQIFPKSLAERFWTQYRIDVNDARFGAWVGADAHRHWSHHYNMEWKKFLSGNPSRDSVFKFAEKMGDKYGFGVMF